MKMMSSNKVAFFFLFGTINLVLLAKWTLAHESEYYNKRHGKSYHKDHHHHDYHDHDHDHHHHHIDTDHKVKGAKSHIDVDVASHGKHGKIYLKSKNKHKVGTNVDTKIKMDADTPYNSKHHHHKDHDLYHSKKHPHYYDSRFHRHGYGDYYDEHHHPHRYRGRYSWRKNKKHQKHKYFHQDHHHEPHKHMAVQLNEYKTSGSSPVMATAFTDVDGPSVTSTSGGSGGGSKGNDMEELLLLTGVLAKIFQGNKKAQARQPVPIPIFYTPHDSAHAHSYYPGYQGR